ncbi:hypothetical protein [Clostridium sp.]|uniref:hypothetical protein n=1 Tax=Clostridium sp. TaxID=1506 RepID=UPI0026376256|nr:hypothetical protein [Clostridium sp.]
MVEGWNKIYRNIQDHWIWTCEPFSRGQAWIDLLLMANHKDNKIMINGTLEIVERGQRVTSVRKLSDRWKWSTKKVTHFLDQLVKDKMIDYESDTSKTLVSILNYDKYQGKETPQRIENTSVVADIGNTKETQKQHESNTEETQKKNERKTEEKQKKTNKNDKEYIKNDKEGKEREEGEKDGHVLPPLSIQTNTHKVFLDRFGETAYRTWMMNNEVLEEDKEIKIFVEQMFYKTALDKYISGLEVLTKKKVEVEVRE